jgi:hypothetical protein
MIFDRENIGSLAEPFLLPANLELIRCVDERQALDATNGVEIPGGIYGVIDAIKVLSGRSEDEAWDYAIAQGVPIGAHIDEHHDALGCGYGRLVEQSPSSVLAPESIPAQERLNRVKAVGGTVMNYVGDHNPQYALINNRRGRSFDPDQAWEAGFRAFNFDRWAAEAYARRLKLKPKQMGDQLENVYKATVRALSPITKFHKI